jgi:ribosomal protein L12E/L44/L45/RPP1/RPP2
VPGAAVQLHYVIAETRKRPATAAAAAAAAAAVVGGKAAVAGGPVELWVGIHITC